MTSIYFLSIKTSFFETPIFILKPGKAKSISLLVGFYEQLPRNLQRVPNYSSSFPTHQHAYRFQQYPTEVWDKYSNLLDFRISALPFASFVRPYL